MSDAQLINTHPEQQQIPINNLKEGDVCPECGTQLYLLIGSSKISYYYCPDEACAWASWL